MIEKKWFKVKCSECKKKTDILSSSIDYYVCEECVKEIMKKRMDK